MYDTFLTSSHKYFIMIHIFVILTKYRFYKMSGIIILLPTFVTHANSMAISSKPVLGSGSSQLHFLLSTIYNFRNTISAHSTQKLPLHNERVSIYTLWSTPKEEEKKQQVSLSFRISVIRRAVHHRVSAVLSPRSRKEYRYRGSSLWTISIAPVEQEQPHATTWQPQWSPRCLSQTTYLCVGWVKCEFRAYWQSTKWIIQVCLWLAIIEKEMTPMRSVKIRGWTELI